MLPKLLSFNDIKVSGECNFEIYSSTYYIFVVPKLPTFTSDYDTSQIIKKIVMASFYYHFKALKIIIPQWIKLVKYKCKIRKFPAFYSSKQLQYVRKNRILVLLKLCYLTYSVWRSHKIEIHAIGSIFKKSLSRYRFPRSMRPYMKNSMFSL